MENDMDNNGFLKTLYEIYCVKGHVSKDTFGMLGENLVIFVKFGGN